MSIRRVVKYFRIHPVLKQQFERFCGALGLDQYQVLEQLISKWCDEHRDQVRLDIYIPNGQVVINQPRQVNVAVKAEITFCRIELENALKCLEVHPDSRINLQDLAKAVLHASKVYRITHDGDLEQLLAKAEAHLK